MPNEDIPVSAVEDDGLPSLDGVLREDMPIGEAEDRLHTARDRPLASTDYGITVEEARHDEPLDQRLAREEPEVSAYPDLDPDAGSVGRLVAYSEGSSEDADDDVLARDVGWDRGIRSAEEAAMHIIRPPRD